MITIDITSGPGVDLPNIQPINLDTEMQCGGCDRIVSIEALEEWEYELGSCGRSACNSKCVRSIQEQASAAQKCVADDLTRHVKAVDAIARAAQRINPESTVEMVRLVASVIGQECFKLQHPVKEKQCLRLS